MVYVNSKKFACESCIKGHRSSSCHHSDRPLFEIKKKGRPVSQCEKCRELRQSKKLHSKCTCTHKPELREAKQPLVSSSTSKTKRFIPIVPALPNGLKDVLAQPSTSAPADERQTVDSLLNPCNCKSLWICKCSATINEKSISLQPVTGRNGLSALASAAAAMECSSLLPETSPYVVGTRQIRPRSPASMTQVSINKRQRCEKRSYDTAPSQNLRLPPLLYSTSSSSSSSSLTQAIPDFDTMPPIEQITSLAGSGCSCGVQCACPGCAEHRRTEDERSVCTEGCRNCVDPTLELSLPSSTSAGSSLFGIYSHSRSNSRLINTLGAKESFLDRFFARAAALPPPPEYRKTSVILDPMDTTPFLNKVGPLVTSTLPKLECCGGVCTCAEGQCCCRPSCVGCGADEVEGSSPTTPTGKSISPPAATVSVL